MLYNHYIFGDFIKDSEPLSPDELDDIFVRADRHLGKIQEVPIDKIVEILDLLSEKWLDPDYYLRKIAIDKMPAIIGYSPQMVEAAINLLFENLKRENLYRILRGHISNPSMLDKFEYNPSYEGYFKAQPLGVVLHISPGNIFADSVNSLVYGFLTKNINLLRISAGEHIFPFLFARSLQDVDEKGYIAGSFSILHFSEDDAAVEAVMKKRCDGIVVYGREEEVRSYRNDLPHGTRLITYEPKFSFAIITAAGFETEETSGLFEKCAMDVVMWEQRESSSPQVIYVEESAARKFLDGFPRYLELADREFPQMNLNFDEKVEVLKAREIARMEEAEGSAMLFHSPRSMRWTVIYEESPEFKISPLNRTVYIKPFKSWADVLGQAVKIKNYLHTAGIAASESQVKMLSKALARLGVSRITDIGTMHRYKPGSPQDFDFPLRKLVKWVNIEWTEKRFDLGDVIAPSKPSISRWERLHNTVKYAQTHSEFYGNHLRDAGPVQSYDDFINIPMLAREDIYQNTPPVGKNLLTAPLGNAYVFAGGGGDEKPAFNYYSYSELEQVSSILADIYQVAGLTSKDTVANLFMAGSLWTSFIVVNHSLEKIGCTTLPIAGNTDMELMIHYMELFRPNVIAGIPSMIMKLAVEIEHRKLSLNFEKILYSGEQFDPGEISYLKKILGTEIIRSTGYASANAGPVGYQCTNCRDGVYHLLYEYAFFEIIDLQTGKPVGKNTIGEIVVTNFHRRLMPIIRYRTGDLGRMLPYSCGCTHSTMLFEVLGRCEDVNSFSKFY
ncbi:MAG: hypothetical protein LWY06_12015 [Firmicutes bacterium]|nr:hypothetical protein [Bacillota bacterium]